jgi:hypothetical protein
VVGEVDFETDSWCGDPEDVVGEDGCGAGGGRRGAEEGVEPSSGRRKTVGESRDKEDRQMSTRRG